MNLFSPPPADLSRRRFVQGVAIGGAVAGLGLLRPSNAWALTSPGQPTVLSGTDFALDIAETPVNYTGATRLATTVNGGIPGPILRWKEGTTVNLRVTNRLRVPTSIHWHGIILPFQEDGVPGISFDGIAPGETFLYQFKVRQSGTYWYHSHSGFQEQTGLYGPLVIEPASPDRHPTDRDYVVMLNDWTDENPERIYAKLKKQSDYYNFAQPTVPDFFRDVREKGLGQALAMRKMWNEMRMNPTDFGDVSGYTYTYLMNGAAPAGNWTGIFKPGEKIRADDLRRAHSGPEDDGDLGRWPGRRAGVGRRISHLGGRNLRRDGRAAGRARVHAVRPVDRSQRLRSRHAGAARRHGSRRAQARSHSVAGHAGHDGCDGDG